MNSEQLHLQHSQNNINQDRISPDIMDLLSQPLQPDSFQVFPLTKEKSSHNLPHVDLTQWTHDSFQDIQMLNGLSVNWIDAFFQLNHPMHPILSYSWFKRNYYFIPIFVLHSMYAMVSAKVYYLKYPKADEPCTVAELHYNYCKSLVDLHVDEPNPITITGIYYVSIYASYYGTSALSGEVDLALVIRLAQSIGIHRNNEIFWMGENGNILGSDKENSRCLCSSLWTLLYCSDFYLSILQKLPFTLTSDQSFYLPDRNAPYYNDEYQSGSWVYLAELLRIARKIITRARAIQKNSEVTIRLQSEGELAMDLNNWFSNLPIWMQQVPEFEDPAYQTHIHWNIGFLHCLYYCLIILTYKVPFVKAFEGDTSTVSSNSIVQLCVNSATTVSNILMRIKQVNPTLNNVPLYSSFLSLVSGIVHCMSMQYKGRHPSITNIIQEHIDMMEIFKSYQSKLGERNNTVWKWLLDPASATVAFSNLL
ncbi:hypothetical protein HDV02_002266 [Globomyces sp. JEL0801]|nr:hypothetical protein HDV02_002266 [Globomyces sp. JEL0801]